MINNRYRIKTSLGKGGVGHVFLVDDMLRGNRLVALKMIISESEHPERLAYLKHEFEQLVQLTHPNLAQAYEFGVVNFVTDAGKNQYG